MEFESNFNDRFKTNSQGKREYGEIKMINYMLDEEAEEEEWEDIDGGEEEAKE